MSKNPGDTPKPAAIVVTLGCGHQASVMLEHFGGSVKCPTCGQVWPLPQTPEAAAMASGHVELVMPQQVAARASSKPKAKKSVDQESVLWPWFMILPFAAVVAVGLTLMARSIGEPWHPAGIMAATCGLFFLTQLGLMVVPVQLLCHHPVGRGAVLATAVAGGLVGSATVVASVGVLVQWFLSSQGATEDQAYPLTPFAAWIIAALVGLLWFFFSLGFIQTASDESPVQVVRRVLVLLLIGAVVGLVCVVGRGLAGGIDFWTDLGIRALVAALVLTITPVAMVLNAQKKDPVAKDQGARG